MTAATLLMAIAALESEALHRRARRGGFVPQLAALHASRFAVAGLLLAFIWAVGR
ncbi:MULTISPECIES: hypothetical protein [Methylobacterium]|uniref:Uncharacterized protein n=1 Tax=Methylobacterium radiotolerans TaxID=31998 RepID=A0ABV2NPP0_9HYPH|nr:MULTISPECIES: hypothetical protein [unclassified Methylobacterium]MBP2494975.1 hypothetical protein [Methylobacterium sp. PvP105]MBP2505154.1 hypothetical protein [Methylobacterium sp. PvP109]